MTKKIRPKALKSGATIGVVSPSYWLDSETLEKGVQWLEGHGYKLLIGESVTAKQDIFAGSPELRANDIMSMFCNESVDAIFCARGGYGANRVIPLLDFDVIRNNAKIFMGFSDITTILNSLAQDANLISFHGPMLASFGRTPNEYDLQQMLNVLGGQSDVIVTDLEDCKAITLREGDATAELVGGNLSLINERLGTPNQIDCDNKILLIEEVGEKLYAFERMMLHLKNSGSLSNIKGIILGEMTEMSDTDVPFGKTVDEIVLDICEDYQLPIISNFPAGHGTYIATLPIGHEVTLVANQDERYIKLTDSPVTK